jgi:DNA mismatch repair ATPase MutS
MQTQTERVAFLCDAGRLGKYQELVESVLDFDLAPREFRVQTTHDDTGELDRIAQDLRDIESQVEDLQARILDKELSGFGAKFETDAKQLRTYGYHFRVPKKQDNMLKKVKGNNYITLAIVASGIKWTTTQLQSLHEQHTSLSNQYAKAQAELVKQARGVADTFMPLFEVAASVLGELDVLGSLAHCAAYAITPYCRPTVTASATAAAGSDSAMDTGAAQATGQVRDCSPLFLS